MSAHPPLPAASPTVFETTADWFARAKAALLDALPCRQGCHQCCIGVFPVTVLDRQELRRGLGLLPPALSQAIQQTAREQAERMSASFPRLAVTPLLDDWPDPEIDRVVEQFSDLPCPALQTDGSCSVYQARPLTCRSMGIPFEVDGLVHGACSVQTSVPLIRLASTFRREEDDLVKAEAAALEDLHRQTDVRGEEMLLPFAFLPETEEEDGTT